MPKIKSKRYERVKHLPNVFIPEPEGKPGNDTCLPWLAEPALPGRLILELGCGKGEHSLHFATIRPDACVVGVDMKSHRLCVGGEKGLAAGLDNLFFLRTDISRDLEDYFCAGTIGEIWITFPDPYPKQRGIKHRLTSPGFLAVYARLLVPGGTVHLKTDSDLLYTYTQEGVAYWGGRILAETRDLHRSNLSGTGAGQILSAFEGKALDRGETVKYLSFTLN
ncbi:MAG: tRNA (guanosine(46)-N7)-methyltransferase TrmB [Desulfobacter sp.]|nr:MAG: tRNA (guanosine(46)-N7)-methyltransferase TrmB [Desulfobacter sp.]